MTKKLWFIIMNVLAVSGIVSAFELEPKDFMFWFIIVVGNAAGQIIYDRCRDK